MSDVGPRFSLVSCLSSDYGYDIRVSTSRLIPNQTYYVWIFYPDGEAIGRIGIRSDEKGNYLNHLGQNEVSINQSGPPLKRGRYIIGIMRGDFAPGHKPYFKD